MFSAGFRPFFLLAGLWSAIAIPLWLCAYAGEVVLPLRGAPLAAMPLTWLAGAAWSAAFLLFVILYRGPLTQIKPIPD